MAHPRKFYLCFISAVLESFRSSGEFMIPKSALAVCLVFFSTICAAQTPPPFVALGDSLGEGDQSADANQLTQPNVYLNRIATQMGVPFALPLIQTCPLCFVGEVNGSRYRIDPWVVTP